MDFGKSGISWGYFNVEGDETSIDEVHRLIKCEARLKSLEKLIERKELVYAKKEELLFGWVP